MTRVWNPTVIGAPVGKYSHLAEVPAGRRQIHISGQVGTLADGRLAGPDAAGQTRQIFANIEQLLRSLGAGPADLVKLTSFVSGVSCLPGYYAARDEVYADWFPDGKYPAHSLAVVAALAKPELSVEIEGIVAVPE
ncbi:RidA family protein [Streptomyces sp. NPDC050485]|uniref:RidA family protein n=1 Tax=Streptomyces sp. NPDC050485 TaxID=3365617 RepID=UPI0037978E25